VSLDVVLANQIDGLGNRADEPPQRPPIDEPLTPRRHRGLVASEQPTIVVGLFNRVVFTLRRVAMAAKYRKLVLYRFRIAADVAGIGQVRDSA
jgi:hypothetical protein